MSRSRYVYRKRDMMKDVYILAANVHPMTSYPTVNRMLHAATKNVSINTSWHPFHFKYRYFLVQLLFQMSFDFPKIRTDILAKFTFSKITLLWSENILNCEQSQVCTFSDPSVFKMINRCALVWQIYAYYRTLVHVAINTSF